MRYNGRSGREEQIRWRVWLGGQIWWGVARSDGCESGGRNLCPPPPSPAPCAPPCAAPTSPPPSLRWCFRGPPPSPLLLLKRAAGEERERVKGRRDIAPARSSSPIWRRLKLEEIRQKRAAERIHKASSGSDLEAGNSYGKSTLACALGRKLHSRGYLSYVLDGDNVRHGLNKDLGFKPEDRAENIRRIGEVARLFADAGVICIASLISPYRRDRDACRALLPEATFIEVSLG